jgi:hypothetical protein
VVGRLLDVLTKCCAGYCPRLLRRAHYLHEFGGGLCIANEPCAVVRGDLENLVFKTVQEHLGLPKFFDASLPACHGLRTPANLHILAKTDALVLPSVCVQTLGVRNKPFRSCTSTAGYAVTPAASRMLCLRFAHLVRRVHHHDSAMDARLDTGGWLALTRQGLAPYKRRQAFLARER